jgi:hypothetical protein
LSFPRLTVLLRDADWLDPSRARAYARILAGVQLLGLIGLLLSAQNGLDLRGEPVGTDFVSFWTAARLALSGASASVYDPAIHHAAEQAVFGPALDWYAFFYPPVYLLYVLPLGLLPYFAALAVWLGATLAGYALTIRQAAAKSFGILPILAFPAVLSTLGHGQNAFLTTALFAGGALLLERRPGIAGLILGALCYKPQMAMLVPLALAVAGRWRALAGFAAGVLILAGLSWLAFGEAAWRAFLAENVLARATLEQGLVDPAKMQSAFAALRVVGAPLPLAYGVQALVSLAAVAVMIRLLRRTPDALSQMAVTAVAGLLATPFVLDYDFTLLALPLAVVLSRALRGKFLPFEKSALLAAYLLPAVARPLALFADAPLSPLVLALFLAVLAQRVNKEAA